MKTSLRTSPIPFLGAFLLFALGGCIRFEPVEDPTRTYLLTPMAIDAAVEEDGLRVSVERVLLPTYLEDRRILLRKAGAEVVPLEFSRWAEPLAHGIARVVAGNLASHPAVEDVSFYPWQEIDPDFIRLRVKVLEFDATRGGAVRLEVLTEILGPGKPAEVSARMRNSFESPIQGEGTAAVVEGYSEVLRQYSEALLHEL